MSIPIPFSPPHLSVNRVRIIDLPGIPIDNQVRGRQAYELLSNRAIARYARERAVALRLPAAYWQDTVQTRVGLGRFVADCLQSSHAPARAAAQEIGRRLGRNLGHILLTLARGDPINRDARPDWTAADWEHWGTIERIWLGGGLMEGQLGNLVLHHARVFLIESGHAGQIRVDLSPHRGDIALLGAARYLPALARHQLCLDLGQTLVKRACLSFESGILVALDRYPPLAVDWDQLGVPNYPDPTRGQRVLDFVVGAITQTLADCVAEGFSPGEDVMLSVAAYVQGGRLLGNGIYAQMNALAEDLGSLLANSVRSRVGKTVRVHFIHDGTAAAAFHAGERNTAVIMVGTALGIGFSPGDAANLRPLGPAIIKSL